MWLDQASKSFALRDQANNAMPKRLPPMSLAAKAATLNKMESIAEEPNEEGSDMLVVSQRVEEQCDSDWKVDFSEIIINKPSRSEMAVDDLKEEDFNSKELNEEGPTSCQHLLACQSSVEKKMNARWHIDDVLSSKN